MELPRSQTLRSTRYTGIAKRHPNASLHRLRRILAIGNGVGGVVRSVFLRVRSKNPRSPLRNIRCRSFVSPNARNPYAECEMKKVASGASIEENTRRPLMLIQQKHFRIKPLEFDLFCGMDVDKKSISLTFCFA